jgi:hypothetical protein
LTSHNKYALSIEVPLYLFAVKSHIKSHFPYYPTKVLDVQL